MFEANEGVVTTHVTVGYEGPAEDFAWVIPVPGLPVLELSSRSLFANLHTATAPIVINQSQLVGCDTDSDTDSDSDADVDTNDTGTSGGSNPGVLVVSEAEVGPYASVVLQAIDGDALVTWLQDNGYGVPGSLSEAVAPYLSPDTYFLALKLSKDFESGELSPIRLTYPGQYPAVPIQLTSVAATDDMPLTVYVLGDERAVPLSYLHVRLNPLLWYLTPDGVLDPHVTDAADEAGGRAFVTLYASSYRGRAMHTSSWFDLSGLPALGAEAWVTQVMTTSGFSGNPDLTQVLKIHIPVPEGVASETFYACPTCFPAQSWVPQDFDAVAATSDLTVLVVEPALAAQEMLDRSPIVTRMQTSMSPGEMTVDPVFGFNADLPFVERTRTSILSSWCNRPDQHRELRLPGDYYVPVPSRVSVGPWLEEQLIHKAMWIEELTESGPGTVLADYSHELDWTLDGYGNPIPTIPPANGTVGTDGAVGADEFCGCTHGGPVSWLAVFGIGILGRRRAVRF